VKSHKAKTTPNVRIVYPFEELHPIIARNLEGGLPSDPYEIREIMMGMAVELGPLALAVNRGEIEVEDVTWTGEQAEAALSVRGASRWLAL
jgi:hypothetical protein